MHALGDLNIVEELIGAHKILREVTRRQLLIMLLLLALLIQLRDLLLRLLAAEDLVDLKHGQVLHE